MGLLTRTKKLFQDKKSPVLQKPPPLPSLSEPPAFATIPDISQRQTPQYEPDLPEYLITADNIRELRELIRYKYALDIEIWKQREVKEYARDHCKENMRRSDAALVTLKNTLVAWDRREFFTSDDEYDKFRDIKDRLMTGDKIVWEKSPPWEVVKRYSAPVRAPYEMNGRPPSVTPPWHGSFDHQYVPSAAPRAQPYPRVVSDPQPGSRGIPPSQPYPRAVSNPQSGRGGIPSSQQVPERRPIPQYHQRVVSAPQHMQRFSPQEEQPYKALPPQTASPRYA